MTGRLMMIALTGPGLWWIGQYVQAVFGTASHLF
jgi:hypothetical protein